MNDREFISAFENCKLPALEWNHASHLRVAWNYLCLNGLEMGLIKIREGIKKYNGTLKPRINPTLGGIGYHETVTWFFAQLVFIRIQNSKNATNWNDFKNGNEDLFSMSILFKHYSHDSIKTVKAREEIIPPDLMPLP